MIGKAVISAFLSGFFFTSAFAATFSVRPNTPMVGETGLLMTAPIALDAYAGKESHIHLPNPRDHAEALAAQALLLHIPRKTRFMPDPTAPFLAQLGQPTNDMPAGYAAAPLFTIWEGRLLKIGDTAAPTLGLPVGGKRVKTPTYPTGVFIAHERADKDYAKGLRFDTVLGREYENGWVLFRTNMYALNEHFWNAHSVTVDLPRPMQRVLEDGTLGPKLTRIDLGGYEGAILINAE